MSREDATAAVAAYTSGTGLKALKEKYRVSYTAVRNEVRAAGIAPQAPKRFRLHPVNHGAFDKITPDSAYWIGFILADGCITPSGYTIQIMLAERDAAQLDKFRSFVESDAPVHRYPPGRNGGPTALLQINSLKLVASLARFGITQRKSFTATTPEELRNNRDFWRGLVDGDGSVSLRPRGTRFTPRIHLCGTYDVVSKFVSYVNRVIGESRAKCSPNRRIWQTAVYGIEARELAKNLYADCTVALDRKLNNAHLMFAYSPAR